MSYANGPRIVTDGLALCLDAGNNKSYPGTDTNWYDLANSNNNGILYNSPSFVNNYFSLDGTNDHIIIPSILDPSSVEIWFYLNNKNHAGTDIYNSNNWQWGIFNFSTQTYWQPGSVNTTSTAINNSIGINKWTNATIVRKSSSSLLYVNGVLISTFGSKVTPTGNIYIGKAGSNYWSGRISMLKLYNKELYSNEILQNYDALKARFGL